MKQELVTLARLKELLFVAALLLALTFLQVAQNLSIAQNHITALVSWHLGTLTAVLLSAQLMERKIFRNWFRCSFLKVATVRTGLYLSFSLLLSFASMLFYRQSGADSAGTGLSLFLSFFLFYALVYFGTTVFLEVSKLTGKAFLEKLILGKYHHPRKERRIFLFIDLKESTRLSKELSLESYSYLIKEFFREVDMAMEKYEGEIYQYAGDEVIVSWPATPANYNKAVLSFLEFFHQMKAKRYYYEQQYGIVPRFKAALHGGKIVGTWVGRMKRELVYQGEVLNIAARVTGLAKNLSYPVLLTQSVVNKLDPALKQRVLFGGSYTLKGVDYPVTVYFLQVNNNPEIIAAESSLEPVSETLEPLQEKHAV